MEMKRLDSIGQEEDAGEMDDQVEEDVFSLK